METKTIIVNKRTTEQKNEGRKECSGSIVVCCDITRQRGIDAAAAAAETSI